MAGSTSSPRCRRPACVRRPRRLLQRDLLAGRQAPETLSVGLHGVQLAERAGRQRDLRDGDRPRDGGRRQRRLAGRGLRGRRDRRTRRRTRRLRSRACAAAPGGEREDRGQDQQRQHAGDSCERSSFPWSPHDLPFPMSPRLPGKAVLRQCGAAPLRSLVWGLRTPVPRRGQALQGTTRVVLPQQRHETGATARPYGRLPRSRPRHWVEATVTPSVSQPSMPHIRAVDSWRQGVATTPPCLPRLGERCRIATKGSTSCTSCLGLPRAPERSQNPADAVAQVRREAASSLAASTIIWILCS